MQSTCLYDAASTNPRCIWKPESLCTAHTVHIVASRIVSDAPFGAFGPPFGERAPGAASGAEIAFTGSLEFTHDTMIDSRGLLLALGTLLDVIQRVPLRGLSAAARILANGLT